MPKNLIKDIVASVDGAGSGHEAIPKLWVSTSNYSLNKVISGDFNKGLPFGKVVEVFGDPSTGKSLLLNHIIANVQKMGGIAILDDTEDAYNPFFGETIGVNNDDLIRLSSLTVEEHFEKVFLGWKDSKGKERPSIIQSIQEHDVDTPIVIALDSLGLLSTRHEQEVKFEKNDMSKAKLIKAAFRMASNVMDKGNILHLISNHVYYKIGIVYGCFSYATRVTLADGSSEKIGKIVNQKLPVEVLSYNQETGKVEARKVVSWFDNGVADYFLQFVTERCGGNGVSQFATTPDHIIVTPRGEIPAKDLKIGDEVFIKAKEVFSQEQREIAFGSCLGDGGLRVIGSHTVQLRIVHGKDQIDYAKWKAELFGDLVSYRGAHALGGWGFDLVPSYDCVGWFNVMYGKDGKRHITEELLQEELTFLALAIWYMDDGTFSGHYAHWGKGKAEISVKSYSKEEQHLLASAIGRLIGAQFTPTVTSSSTLLFSGERTEALHQCIAKYIYPSMKYKLHPSQYEKFELMDCVSVSPKFRMVPGKILDIYEKPMTRSMHKFDIEVEGNHTYLVDGVCVHNSPKATPGGSGTPFQASVRLDLTLGKKLKDDNEKIIGVESHVTVAKNRLCAPFGRTTLDIKFDSGVDPYSGLLEVFEASGILKAEAQGFYMYGTERFRKGKFPEFLEAHREELLGKVVEKGVVDKKK